MPQPPEIVITGLGVVSPIGIGDDAMREAFLAGRSGVGPLTRYPTQHLPVQFGAEIDDFDARAHVRPRKNLKVMCREVQLGVVAAALAVEDADIESAAVDPERLGVILGSELFYGEIEELVEVYRNSITEGRFRMERWGERVMSDLYPLWMLKYLPNMPACHVAIAHDARGPCNTIAVGDASGLIAIGEGMRLIERGWADAMIVGGTGTRLNLIPMLGRQDWLCSHRNDDPAAACRPFDRDRDGIVNGEGAGALVLETRRHAEARGANILGRALGFGSSFEAADRNGGRRSGSGIRRSIEAALREANATPGDIGHVNAHGQSGVDDDAVEAAAIRATLGDVAVTAPKSYFGNLGAGGPVVELAATFLAFDTGEVVPTLNYDQPDPDCPIDVVHGAPRQIAHPLAVVLSQSLHGQAAALVLGRA